MNFVTELMREAGIMAKTKRRVKHTTDSNHRFPLAENVLERAFNPAEPNARGRVDITYIPTREGWLYLAVAEDLFSRAMAD